MKLKLGLSTTVLAVLAACVGLSNNLVALLLTVGYVFFCEEDLALRQTTAKVLLAVLAYNLVGYVFELIPDVVNLIPRFLSFFDVYVDVPFVDSLCSFVNSILYIAEKAALLVIAVLALMQKGLPVKAVDTFVEKHFK
ncbi:MAG: hypothetical protein IKC95_06430 [Oscillospiraceae bacterium]|nr:hypothetical protein [Oscillospiraceae bacterium]